MAPLTHDGALAMIHRIKGAPLLQGALGLPLHALAIDALAIRLHGQNDILNKLLSMPAIDLDTILEVGRVCGEEASELIATNEERLLKYPKIIEILYLNRKTRMSTADRMIELAVRNNVEVGLPAWKEAATAIQNELIPEPSDGPTYDDIMFAQNVALAEQMRAHGEEIEERRVGKECCALCRSRWSPYH